MTKLIRHIALKILCSGHKKRHTAMPSWGTTIKIHIKSEDDITECARLYGEHISELYKEHGFEELEFGWVGW